ncbi:glutaredoxin family protein [Oceanidesulfovibrio marinus]|nr:glutaredoxin family protein [Oceanidesulfovibrio marinus]
MLGMDFETVNIDYMGQAAQRALLQKLEQRVSPVAFPLMILNPGDDMTRPKLFALSTCMHCARVKALLISLHVDFDTLYVDRLAGEERSHCMGELENYTPELSFPTLVVGDDVVIGAREQRIREILLG